VPAAPCSRPDAPRAVTACPLDPPDPRSRRVRTSRTRRHADPSILPVVRSPARPDGDFAGHRVLHQPRRRTGGGAQQAPAPAPRPAAHGDRRGRRAAGPPARRRSTRYRRTHVRSTGDGVGRSSRSTGHSPARTADVTREPMRAQRAILRAIRWYQRAAYGRPSPCRFFPSCSEYAVVAVETHGARRGASLAVRRLLRCRPFGPSGYDPVPELHAPSSRWSARSRQKA
jgi:putative membrane protein insertion efficiency factor